MLRREALVLIKCLNMHSKPLSRLSMLTSKAPSPLWVICIFSKSALPFERALTAKSIFSNSFTLSCLSSQETTPLCIYFETSDHLLGFDFNTGVDKNNTSDWKIEMLIALTSVSTLITVESWWSWLKSGEASVLLFIFFIAASNFLESLFIFFLEQM